MAKQIFTKIKEEIEKMRNSADIDYTQTYIPWRKHDGFLVECERGDADSQVFDEDGTLIEDLSGKVLGIEVYYQKDRNDIDVCSFSAYSEAENLKSLKEFIRMYE